MGRFKYSDDELDINKVLKMNQDVSNSMMKDQDVKKIRNAADSSIDSSLELLRSLGMNKEVLKMSTEIANNKQGRKLVHQPVLETWEAIVEQANLHESMRVELEDIMTASEIEGSFRELDKINDEFSKKTGIINKTDLSFLAIATALQVAKSLVFPYVAEKFDYGKSFDPSERLAHNDKSIEKAHREANDKFRDKKWKNTEQDTGLIFYIKRCLMISQKAQRIWVLIWVENIIECIHLVMTRFLGGSLEQLTF